MPKYIRSLPEKFVQHIHPTYRPLLKRRRNRKIKVKRSIVNSIKRRLLYRRKIARVAPFYCQVCTLNTRHYTVLKNHDCSMVNESRHIVSYENEVRIASLGIKSKAKDATAVMERLPNPQDVSLSLKIRTYRDTKPGTLLRNPPLLRDICLQKIERPEENGETAPWEQDYDRLTEEEIEKRRKELEVMEKSQRLGEYSWRCNICSELFKSFADHDDHLATGDCMEKGLVEPIRIDPYDPTLSYPLNWKLRIEERPDSTH